MILFLFLFVCLQTITNAADKWHCDSLSSKTLIAGVEFSRLNCTGSGTEKTFGIHFDWSVGPMVFSIVRANLTVGSVVPRASTAYTTTNGQLAPLNKVCSN
jgi:hypothetical protein